MQLQAVELRRVAMPLVSPFRTSFGTQTARDILLVRAITADGDGWAECSALADPRYSAEYVDGAQDVITRFFVPALAQAGDIDAYAVGRALSPFSGHWMAKSALETAVLDAQLRQEGQSFGRFLGAARDRVPCGVSVGIMDSVPQLLDAVEQYLDQGYLRIKLKIEPGWDLEPVRAVRERFGDIELQVDANTAYGVGDARHLAKLDPFELLLIEQPLEEDDIIGHAELARLIRTPVCLDESITSARTAAAAIRLGACSIVNVKPRASGATSRPDGSTTCASRTASPSGAAGCSRAVSGARPTSRSRPSPASP